MAWAPNYATTAEARSYVTRHADTVDDTELALAITASSRAIDLHTHRQFGVVTAQERFYTPRWDRRRCRWIIEFDDLMSESGADYQLQDADGNDRGAIDAYTLEDVNAAAIGRPWTRMVVKPTSTYLPTGLENEAAFTAPWGWTAVPDTIKQATLLQTSRLFTRRNAPFGIAGSPESGSEMRLLARVDPDVAVTIAPYVRWWAAA